MLRFKLALKNLLSAGTRTWLSATILALACLIMVFYMSVLQGWNMQAKTDAIAWQIGQGEIRHPNYDPYDPFTIDEGHGKIPGAAKGAGEPILVRQASIYPQGRLQNITLKGIDQNQDLLSIPTSKLKAHTPGAIPVVIGNRMATMAKLAVGDKTMLRWRDKGGTFDAAQIIVADIFKTNVPEADMGILWVGIDQLHTMTGLSNEASYLVLNNAKLHEQLPSWNYVSKETLLEPVDAMVAAESITAYIVFIILSGLAALAIFDTQVLSIFRRQKEIGTFIALGMTRQQVVRMFTIEGTTLSFIGVALAAIIGIPLGLWLSNVGVSLGEATESMNINLAQTIYPVFGAGLIVATSLVIIGMSAVVSYLPARKIAQMEPTLALKGKIQ